MFNKNSNDKRPCPFCDGIMVRVEEIPLTDNDVSDVRGDEFVCTNEACGHHLPVDMDPASDDTDRFDMIPVVS